MIRLPVHTHLEDEKTRIANPHPLPWSGIPPGRQRLVPKVEPETGEADGIGYAYHAS